jgi:hypothetical protein
VSIFHSFRPTQLLIKRRYVWYAAIAFAVLGVAAAFLTVDYGHFLTDEVSRKMHGKTVGVTGDAHTETREKEVV